MQKASSEAKTPIKSLSYFDCGYCVNQLAFVYKGRGLETRKFPAGVFLIEHSEHGYILFDTGYSTRLWQSGLKGFLYRILNPTKLQPQEDIKSQLKALGIETSAINYVILSHLHPDHSAGLEFFPKSKIIISQPMLESYRENKFKSLIFKNLIPAWFETNAVALSDAELSQKRVIKKNNSDLSISGYDLFSDGSIIITPLPGHAKGHLGALVNETHLLAADASWGEDLMEQAANMRAIAKLIQADYDSYLATLKQLKKLKAFGVELCFSHDHYLNPYLIGGEE